MLHLQDVGAVPVHRVPVAASRQVHAGERERDEADGERRERHGPSGSRSPQLRLDSGLDQGHFWMVLSSHPIATTPPSGIFFSRLSFPVYQIALFFKKKNVRPRAPGSSRMRLPHSRVLWLRFEGSAWPRRCSHHQHPHHPHLPPLPPQQRAHAQRARRYKPAL